MSKFYIKCEESINKKSLAKDIRERTDISGSAVFKILECIVKYPSYVAFDGKKLHIVDARSFEGSLLRNSPDYEKVIPTGYPERRYNERVVDRSGNIYVIEKVSDVDNSGDTIYCCTDESVDFDGTVYLRESDILCRSGEFKTWKDLIKSGEGLCGYISDEMGLPCVRYDKTLPEFGRADVTPNNVACDAVNATVKISWLVQTGYGGWCPTGLTGYAISPILDEKSPGSADFTVVESKFIGGALRFHDKDYALEFLQNNRQLVEDYFMIK